MNLHGYLAHHHISPVVKKGLFSGRYILYVEYLVQAGVLYETCSVLGYTFRDRLTIFLKLLAEEGRENDLIKVIATPATERLAGLKDEPRNFYELFIESERTKLMKLYSKLNKHSLLDDFTKIMKNKMPLDYAFNNSQMIAAEGIGFGYHYPDITERLFSYVFDEQEWNKWYKAGLDIGSEPPKRIPLPILEAQARELITPFVKKTRPDLLDSLGLKTS